MAEEQEKTNQNTAPKNNEFKTLKELAALWGCHPVTLCHYVKKLADKIPNYTKYQKLYSPAQYKALAHELGFDI